MTEQLYIVRSMEPEKQQWHYWSSSGLSATPHLYTKAGATSAVRRSVNKRPLHRHPRAIQILPVSFTFGEPLKVLRSK
jgi:hypothetical protein